MARQPRALVIACERYPQAKDVARRLPGTLDAAREFCDWLVNTKNVRARHVYLCCDEVLTKVHSQYQTYKGNREDIISAITHLVEHGSDKTSELYVFFSGHGIGWEVSPQRRGVDVLLASDYRNRKRSGASCIKVDELRSELRDSLGGEDHYYFLDACRTVLKVGEIQPTELGLTLDRATSGDPTTYVLYSTKFGEVAPVNSGFSKALLQGLEGMGRAKQKMQGKWWVRFDRLQKYIQERVKNKTDLLKEGERDGLILRLENVSPTTCTVAVENAHANDDFVLKVEYGGSEKVRRFKGAQFQDNFFPSDDGYEFDLKTKGISLPRLTPPSDSFIDLYDPVTLRFTMSVPKGVELVRKGGPSGTPQIRLRGFGHPGLAFQIRHSDTGRVLPARVSEWIKLQPGSHVVEMLENGSVVRRRNIELRLGEQRDLDLFGKPASRVQRSIVERLPSVGPFPDASETLGGPIVHEDTALWLTLLGASRLIRSRLDFSKLGPFPLATFDDLNKGDCVLYALAGLDIESSPKIAVSESPQVEWHDMEEVLGLEGVYHFRLKLKLGPQLVSFAFANAPPVTYATYALANRAVLMSFSQDEFGRLDTRQMLLPVYSLAKYLDWVVKERIERESLRLVKYLVLAQERFAQRQSVQPTTDEERSRLKEMLYGKWIDPLLALMAIFEAARRGKIPEERLHMQGAITNLGKYFGGLPDVSAATHVLGMKTEPGHGAPLLLESLLRMPELRRALPISADFLDYGSMWTSWFGAVNRPQ